MVKELGRRKKNKKEGKKGGEKGKERKRKTYLIFLVIISAFLILFLLLSLSYPSAYLIKNTEDGKFIRGDVNNDGRIDIADGIAILNYLFMRGAIPDCLDKADVNDDGKVDMADAIYVFNFLFGKGPKPKQPFPTLGYDLTPDDPYTCGDPLERGNVKDISRYSQRQVFLISDRVENDVLQLVPIAVWTEREEKEIRKYPVLIFHEEETGFDADSIIQFIRLYEPEKITLVGEIPDKLKNIISEISISSVIEYISLDDYLDYWLNFNDIVYVDDYGNALVASTYASLKNIPIIIKGSSLDKSENFKEKNVVLIGKVSCPVNSASCQEYTLSQIQKKYIGETKTTKVIVVNPNDLHIELNSLFRPEISDSGFVANLFSKTSLSAPFLSAGKHEVLLTISLQGLSDSETCKQSNEHMENANEFKKRLDSAILNLFQEKPEIGRITGEAVLDISDAYYLTILASPLAIVESKFIACPDSVNEVRESLDTTLYSDTTPYTQITNMGRFHVGRIYGFTVSDVSSYIARSLFYEELYDRLYGKKKEKVLLVGHSFRNSVTNVHDGFSFLKEKDYDVECISDFSDKGYAKIIGNEIFMLTNLRGKSQLIGYNLETKEINVIDENLPRLNYASFTANDRYGIVVNPSATIVLIYDLVNKKKLAELSGSVKTSYSLSGDYFIYNDFQKNIHLYYIPEKTERVIEYNPNMPKVGNVIIGESTIMNDKLYFIETLNYRQDGEWYYSYTIKSIDLDTETPKDVHEIPLAKNPGQYPHYLTSSKKNNLLIWRDFRDGTGYDELSIMAYDLNTEKEFRIGKGIHLYSSDVRYNSEDYLVFASSREGEGIRVYDLGKKTSKELPSPAEGKAYYAPSIDGNNVLYIEKEKNLLPELFSDKLHIYNLVTKQEREIKLDESCDTSTRKIDLGKLSNSQFIFYSDHGLPNEWSMSLKSSEIPELKLPYAFSYACLTNSFWQSEKTDLFSLWFLREGGIGYHGAVGMGGNDVSVEDDTAFEQALKKLFDSDSGLSMGELTSELANVETGYDPQLRRQTTFGNTYLFLGDPTIRL